MKGLETKTAASASYPSKEELVLGFYIQQMSPDELGQLQFPTLVYQAIID